MPQQEQQPAVDVPIPPLRPEPVVLLRLPIMHPLHTVPTRQVRVGHAPVRVQTLAGAARRVERVERARPEGVHRQQAVFV